MSRILGIAASFLVGLALLGWPIATHLGAEAVAQGTELYRYRRHFARVFARHVTAAVWPFMREALRRSTVAHSEVRPTDG